jgi:hypothetical protein
VRAGRYFVPCGCQELVEPAQDETNASFSRPTTKRSEVLRTVDYSPGGRMNRTFQREVDWSINQAKASSSVEK